MNLKQRIRDDETGFAIVLAVALIAVLSIFAAALPLLVQNEDSKSRRDTVQDSAYQAAEAGTNAVLSDLTQSTAFFTKYMAKGEATRTFNSTTYANDCVTGSTSTTQSTCTDKDVSATTWTNPWWTYSTSQTARAADKGWYSLGNGYQYLIQLYPPNTSLTGLAATITRMDVTGRPFGSTDTSTWRTIETQIRPSSLTDFQAFVASESGGVWGSAQELPGTAVLNGGGAAEALYVSCVSSGDCRAVGYYTDSVHNYQAFLATEAGGVWGGSVEAPGTAALNSEGNAQLNVVSCTSDGSCSAGGQYKDSAGYLQAMILDASSSPATAPSAPSLSAASHAKGKVTVTVHPGANGGSPITGYQYSLNSGGWRNAPDVKSSFVITHLKSGSRVRVRVRALNAAGSSGPSVTVTVRVR